MHLVCLGTALLKGEKFTKRLEYSKQQLLLTLVMLIFTWPRQSSNWCTLI